MIQSKVHENNNSSVFSVWYILKNENIINWGGGKERVENNNSGDVIDVIATSREDIFGK